MKTLSRRDPLDIDNLILNALEIIGSITCISRKAIISKNKIESTKLHLFWKTIQHISSHQLDEKKDSYERLFTEMVLTAFSDKQTSSNGRTWLPMHWAVVVPGVELEDIRDLFTDQPNSLSTFTKLELPRRHQDREISVAPCHLAVMTKTPNMDLIEFFKTFDKNFGKILTSNRSTPLHLAAEFSNSVALIKQLIQLNPQALELRNFSGDIPLICVSRNRYPAAPDILEALIDAAPQTIRLPYYGSLPLQQFLNIETNSQNEGKHESTDISIQAKLVIILLEAFPDAIDITESGEWLPIHRAAMYAHVDILKIITEANPENLTKVVPVFGSAAHCAAVCERPENARYIHYIMPELFLTLNDENMTPLDNTIEVFNLKRPDLIDEMISLAPEAAGIVDSNKHHGINVLHSIVRNRGGKQEGLVRQLLRLIPGAALETNMKGQTPYDLLDVDNPDHDIVRRLLLLAGAPSLHPETRKQMNYQARKGALFAFFAPRGQHHSCGGKRLDICYRIRNGAGAMEIMRQVISFL